MNPVRQIPYSALLNLAIAVSACRVAQAQSITPSRANQPASSTQESAPAEVNVESLRRVPPPEDVPAPLPAAGQRAAPGMSLSEFEAIALGSSPALAQASARVAATQGRWLQAGLYPNPLIGYSGQQLGSGGQAEQNGVLIEQEFVTAHKVRNAQETAAWEIRRAQQEFEAVRFRVLTDVRVGFYQLLFAERRLTVARDLAGINERVMTSAEQLFNSGEVGRADVLRAKIERDAVLIDVRTAENRLDASWRRLTAAIAAPQMERRPLAGNPEEAIRDISWDGALDSILSQSPELAAARAAVQRAAWQVRLERSRVYPNLTVQAIVQYDEAVEQTNANVQATVPLPLFNRNQGAIREALAEQVAAEAAFDRTALQLQRELGAVFERYANARFQSRKYAEDLLPTARETLDLVRGNYDAGESAFIDLLTAQRTYSQIYLAYIDSLREAWLAMTEIDGFLLDESLAQSSAGD